MPSFNFSTRACLWAQQRPARGQGGGIGLEPREELSPGAETRKRLHQSS